jgi:CRP-like cAMP-binding protein
VCIEVGTRSYVVWVQALGPGEAFGWSALLDHHDTLFQVRAREASRALCLDGERLCAVLHADPELAAEVLRRTLKLVAGRLQATEARLGEMCGVRMGKDLKQAARRTIQSYEADKRITDLRLSVG